MSLLAPLPHSHRSQALWLDSHVVISNASDKSSSNRFYLTRENFHYIIRMLHLPFSAGIQRPPSGEVVNTQLWLHKALNRCTCCNPLPTQCSDRERKAGYMQSTQTTDAVKLETQHQGYAVAVPTIFWKVLSPMWVNVPFVFCINLESEFQFASKFDLRFSSDWNLHFSVYIEIWLLLIATCTLSAILTDTHWALSPLTGSALPS